MKKIKKILIFVSVLSFLGTTSFGMIRVWRNILYSEDSNDYNQIQELTPEQKLAQQARGYEAVLQREPENRVALEGLVAIRLQMNDLAKAVKPLKKLADLYPEVQEYQALVNQLEEEISQRHSSSPDADTINVEPSPTTTVN